MNIADCTTHIERTDALHIRATLTNSEGVSVSVTQEFELKSEANRQLERLILMPVFDIAQRIAHIINGGKRL